MAEGSSPKQSLMSRDVTDDSQKEMRNHRAKVRELMSAGESFIATLNKKKKKKHSYGVVFHTHLICCFL